MSGATTIAAPRRPTGKALLRRLLKQPECELRYWNTRLVPIGARIVLEAIADLVARSPQEGQWQPETDLEDFGTAGWLAVKLRAMGSEAEVDGYLDQLKQARLVRISETGAVSLALPAARAVEAGQDGFHPVSRSPGRPPSWMSEAEKEQFKAIHRERYQAQQRMQDLLARGQGRLGGGLMVIPGGDQGDPNFRRDIHSDIGPDIPASISDVDIGAASVSISDPISASRAEEDDDSRIYSLKSSSSSSSPDIRAQAPGDISAPVYPGGISNPDIGQAERTAAAERAAREVNHSLGAACGKVRDVSRTIESWLNDRAAHADLLQEALQRTFAQHRKQRQERKPGIGDLSYVRKVWDELIRARVDYQDLPAEPDAELPSSAGQPAPVDPRVLGQPQWAAAKPVVQRNIARVLDALAEPRAGERKRLLSSCFQVRHEAFVLVGAVHPEIYDLADKDRPAGSERRAAAG